LGLVLAIAMLTATGARAQRLALRSYTESDGLADNAISRIVRDSRGFLWFCTAQGLSRFDGYAFTTFGVDQGLPAAQVNDVLETRRGDYFVATGGGLVRFDPKGAPMFSLVPWADAGQHGKAVNVLREGHDGSVWAGTDEGLFRLDLASNPASLRSVDIGIPRTQPGVAGIEALIEDRRGSLWVGGRAAGLFRRWPDGTFARYTTVDVPGDSVETIFESREGHLWIGTRVSGFFTISVDDTHRPPIVGPSFTYPEIPTTMVSQLAETSDGRFWIANAGALLVFSSEAAVANRHFQTLSTRNGLPNSGVTALVEDIGGGLWLGTYGAARLLSRGLTTYGERDGLRWVSALFEDRTGRLCFRGGVVGNYSANRSVFEGEPVPLVSVEQTSAVQRVGCFDGRRFSAFYPGVIRGLDWLDGWKQEHVTLQTRRGDWWVASGNGVYHFPAADSLDSLRSARPLGFYTIGHGLAARQGFNLFEDSRGLVWISTIGYTDHGLARWNPSDGQMHDLAGSVGLPNVATRLALSFAEDATGSVWIGYNGALTRYRDGRFVTFDAANALPPGRIWEIHVDRAGTLWLASSESGLIRVDHAGTDHPRFRPFTMKDGLSTNNVEVVVEDLAGNIYTGGNHGIDRLDAATGEVTHYTTDDGAAPGLLRSAFRDRQGVLWFGTDFGLTRLDPSNQARRPSAGPDVFIRSVRVGGVLRPVSALGERTVSLPDLSPSEKEVSIDYSALRFLAGESPRYQLRLVGADNDWSAARTDRSITYANLGPGQYTFQVRALGANGAVSAGPASVSFTILAPIWRRAWFIALVVVAVGLAARAVYQRRVARLLELANMRTRIASDLHDDIGANLTRIALLSDAAQSGDGHGATIGRIARESVATMGDIVWAIKPERESLIDLTRRMRQQADDLFVPRDIELRFDAPPAEANIHLPVDLRRDVLLFFKETLTNVARHSHCTRVEIDLSLDGPHLTLVVTDNGSGFDLKAEHQGQGLRSLARRAAILKASLSIASEPGHGTTISLNVPL
jgi:signal transduction histidine kinase/ligand-binding sensor domain-containing protein